MATSVCGRSATKRTGPRLRRVIMRKRSTPFSRCHDSPRATPEICEREIRNRRKRWITHRMSTHRTATQRKGLRHIVNQPLAWRSTTVLLIYTCIINRSLRYPPGICACVRVHYANNACVCIFKDGIVYI